MLGKLGGEAAKPRLIPNEHMPKAASRAAKPFILPLDSVGGSGICYWSVVSSHSGGGFIQVFRYRFDPHSFPETYRSLAQTSIQADLPPGNVPATRVRLRISRFICSITLFVRIFSKKQSLSPGLR